VLSELHIHIHTDIDTEQLHLEPVVGWVIGFGLFRYVARGDEPPPRPPSPEGLVLGVWFTGPRAGPSDVGRACLSFVANGCCLLLFAER
jgi:hypothetical protein